jgi:hypothetical protein
VTRGSEGACLCLGFEDDLCCVFDEDCLWVEVVEEGGLCALEEWDDLW